MDRRSLLVTAIALAVVSASSCRDRRSRPPLDSSTIESWADLPGALGSGDARLLAEVKRIADEHGTPQQLVRDPPPADQNIATALAALFDADELQRALERSEALVRRGDFQLNPVQLEQAIRLRQPFAKQLEQLHAALRRRSCQFAVDYRRGFFAKNAFIDVVTLCVRLEALRVAELLDRDQPGDALESLKTMFRLAALLAAEKLVAARLSGANLRAVTFDVLAACVRHPRTAAADLESLSALVQQQLRNWPDDADAWVGDRALALHSYEAIRAGYLPLLLTAAERQSLREEGVLDGLPERLRDTADADQRFYLDKMRAIIDSCQQPYHERRATLAGIRRQLQALRNTDTFPFAAARLFLVGIEQGHHIQARDRARCEAWAIALALATGQQRPAFRTNPVTGMVYAVSVEPGRVTVWGGVGEDGDVIVPRPLPPGESGQSITPSAGASRPVGRDTRRTRLPHRPLGVQIRL